MTELKHSLKDLCVNLLITSTCNAGCPWCIANKYMKAQCSPLYMADESFEKFFLMLSRDNVAQVNLLGGEPSLHPKSLDFGRRISEIGVPVGYSTNGLWQEDFRRQLEKVQYPIEFEVTFLGSKGYSPEKLVQIMRSFEQLRNHHTSIGLILTSPNESYKEHLELAEKYGFDLRWAILEPTPLTGQTEGYSSQANIRKLGKHAVKIIREANQRGIHTWADLTVPHCAIEDEDRDLFQGGENDIQYRCPPFFDISTDLKIWRCLPMAPDKIPAITDFRTFREAYQKVDEVKRDYVSKGVYPECNECPHLEQICSGGPAIAKKLQNEN